MSDNQFSFGKFDMDKMLAEYKEKYPPTPESIEFMNKLRAGETLTIKISETPETWAELKAILRVDK